MGTADGPEASLSDALQDELRKKVIEFVQQRGLVATVVVVAIVKLVSIGVDCLRAIRQTCTRDPAKRLLLEDVVLNALLTGVLVGCLWASNWFILNGSLLAPVVTGRSYRVLIAGVTALQLFQWVVLNLVQTVRYCRAVRNR